MEASGPRWLRVVSSPTPKRKVREFYDGPGVIDVAPSRRGMRTVALVVLGFVVGAGVWYTARRPASQTRPAVAVSTRAPSGADRVGVLDNSLRALADAERDSPRDRWEPEYVVQLNGRDAAQLFAWVRDNTVWIPYRGVLRGPVGVLMDREGNSLDRSLLLATLLAKSGHSVRLAHGQLTSEQAIELLPDLIARQTVAAIPSDIEPEPDLDVAAATYRLDPVAVERTRIAHRDGVGRLLAELQARVADQTQRLVGEVPVPDPRTDADDRFKTAADALRDHWWVQRQDAGRWVDLDLLTSGGAALTTATSTTAATDLPPDVHHELAVRVVTERWSAGGVEESETLRYVLRPSQLVGEPIALQIWPSSFPKQLASDPKSDLGLRGVALAQKSWDVGLIIGAKVAARAVITASADAQSPAGSGLFGGLGAGIAGAVQQKAEDPSGSRSGELTAVWIEYEIRQPGEPPRTMRRAVYDVFGAAARADHATKTLALDERKRLTRSLALMLRTEILPITSRIPPEYLSHLTARSLLANRNLLRSVLANWPSAAALDPERLVADAAPTVSQLYTLAFARLEWSRYREVQYVDRIGILTRHHHPGLVGNNFTVRGAVDVIAGDVGVSLAEEDAFAARQEQGVLDTNAEALWWVGEGLNNTGEAYATSTDWVTLSGTGADVEALGLSADARVRIKQDLASGLVVVAPKHPVPRGPDEFIGWWRIDPRSGATQGVTGNGWGQCGAEYGVTLEGAFWYAARNFAFEYGLCLGLAQAVNGFRAAGAELQARGIWFWWLPPIQSASAKDVLMASNGACVVSAITAGLVSTLPFLIARYNVATRPWILPRLGPVVSKLPGDKKGAGRIPPGLVKGPVRGDPRPTLPSIQIPEGAGTRPKGSPNPNYPPYPPPEPPAPRAPIPMPRRPGAPPVTPELEEAWKKYSDARWAATDATSAYNRYKLKNGGNFDDPALTGLERVANQKFEELNAAGQQVKQAQAAARRAAGKGGFPQPAPTAPAAPPPAAPGCPPNCGNNNPTVPQLPAPSSGGEAEVGSAGVASSFYPVPPFPTSTP